jgi:sugar lactone lactonase YvrE
MNGTACAGREAAAHKLAAKLQITGWGATRDASRYEFFGRNAMATASFHSLRRLLASMLTLLLICVCVEQKAAPQGTPQVTSTFVTAMTHPAGWGQIIGTAITTGGDLLVIDTGGGALYEFPANGGAMVTLVAAGGLVDGYGNMNYNPDLALDSQNTLYLTGNWSNCLLRFPYDSATKTWIGLSAITPTTPTSSSCSGPNVFIQYNLGGQWPDGEWGIQPFGLATDINDNIILSSNIDNSISKVPVTVTGGVATPGTPTNYIHKLSGLPDSIAVDQWNNLYFVMNGVLAVYEIPAGTPDQAGISGLPRVDPNLTNVYGVKVDSTGNVYISDAVEGVVMLPSAGGAGNVPQTSAAVVISPVSALGAISIDWQRDILYVPTKPASWSGWNGYFDVVSANLNIAELGSTPVGTPITAALYYAFSSTITPASIVVEEAGLNPTDFAVATGGSCQTGQAYSAGASCMVNVTLNPHVAGGVSAKLLVKDGSGNVLASTVLHGTGLAPLLAVAPALESVIGGNLMTPSEVAVDALGNSYVADAGLGSVLMYAAGASASTVPVSVGTVKTPTGVAVDGAGDVFIADSGNVYEVPNTTSGLNTAGQITLKSGLGTNLNLAVDGDSNVYIADPDNQRVVKLSNPGGTFSIMAQTESDITGFNAPSLVATDASGNLYVVDGANLIQVTPVGQQTTLTNTLSNATGLALDPSSALYVSTASGTSRIPYVSGAWVPSSMTSVAASVTNPKGLAIDPSGNIYLADGTAENIHVVSTSGSLNFGTLALGDTPSLDTVLTNEGNVALNITGFTSTNSLDFSASGTSCTAAAIAQGTTCDVTVTMSPGPGEQGSLSSQIEIQGNQANSSVAIDAVGVGAPLANSVTSISVATTAIVTDVPVTVKVAPQSGSVVPTGNVALSVDGGTATTMALTNGSARFDLMPISAGSHTFSVEYQGDRVYGRSSASISATVAKGSATMSLPAPPQYVLSDTEVNNDAGTTPYFVTYKMQVKASAGTPTGTVTFMDGSSPACGAGVGESPATVKLDANGYASFTTDCLSVPTDTNPTTLIAIHTITPVYNGDSNYQSYTGSSITFNVLRNPSVAITSSPASVSVTAGATVSANLTLTSVEGYGSSGAGQPIWNYTLPLALECNGLPAHSTCTFSSSSINVTTTTPGTATVTIQTNVPVGTTTASIQNSQKAPFAYAALFGIGFFGLLVRGRRKSITRYLALLCILALGGVFTGITACSTNTLSQSADSLKTPAGTYAVTITAQQVGSVTVPGSNNTLTTVYGSHDQISLPFTINVTVQ